VPGTEADKDDPTKATDDTMLRYEARIMKKQMLRMKADNECLTAMVQQLNLDMRELLQTHRQLAPLMQVGAEYGQLRAREQQGQLTIPEELIDGAEDAQVSTQMVEWSPARQRRRSKKTVLHTEERSPLREPAGMPEKKKKKRVSATPEDNRFGVLGSDQSDEDMGDAEQTVESARAHNRRVADAEARDRDRDIERCGLRNRAAAAVHARVNNLRVHNTFTGPSSSTETGAGSFR
jgi:hypothetical protein